MAGRSLAIGDSPSKMGSSASTYKDTGLGATAGWYYGACLHTVVTAGRTVPLDDYFDVFHNDRWELPPRLLVGSSHHHLLPR
jgi:hypothetical protein